MKKSNEIPGFLPEDYDAEPQGKENRNSDLEEKDALKLAQQEYEDGNAFRDFVSAEYDSYIVLANKKDRYDENGRLIPGTDTGTCHIDSSDLDAKSNMASRLAYYALTKPEVELILRYALKRLKKLKNSEPDPTAHKYLARDERFHLNRYRRISSEERTKVENEFSNTCGDFKQRQALMMKIELAAIADQLNDNEAVEADFFCNFNFEVHTNETNEPNIKVKLLSVPCTWDEATSKRDNFVELCKQYNVACNIPWFDI